MPLPSSPLNHVSVAALSKAKKDFHFRGWCVFKALVEENHIASLHREARRANYITIFNKVGNERRSHKDTRKAGKSSELGDLAIGSIFDMLKNEALILGPDHILEMGRGASFLKTPPGCSIQESHTDFDFSRIDVSWTQGKDGQGNGVHVF